MSPPCIRVTYRSKQHRCVCFDVFPFESLSTSSPGTYVRRCCTHYNNNLPVAPFHIRCPQVCSTEKWVESSIHYIFFSYFVLYCGRTRERISFELRHLRHRSRKCIDLLTDMSPF